MTHLDHSPKPAMRRSAWARRVSSVGAIALLALSIVACKSARAKKFAAEADAVCACKDADCAKKAGTVFVDDYDAVMKEKIDWQSAEGKRDSTAITDAGKVYNGCLSKFETREAANAACTEDAKGKTNTEGCTACCREHGRVFDYWVDPLAAGLVGMLGGPKNKGCGCK